MATNLPRCMELINVCYNHPDPAICLAAEEMCMNGVILYYDGEAGAGGRNRFDITDGCETKDALCYPEFQRIQDYMNMPDVWNALSVPKAVAVSVSVRNTCEIIADFVHPSLELHRTLLRYRMGFRPYW